MEHRTPTPFPFLLHILYAKPRAPGLPSLASICTVLLHTYTHHTTPQPRTTGQQDNKTSFCKMRTLATAVVLAMCCTAAGNMIDVIEDLKVAPATCAHGCDNWDQHATTLWKAGVVPAEAGNHCAQPGAVVNTYVQGAWCYCKPSAVVVQNTSDVVPPSWDSLGSGLCEVEQKQFGETAPQGFAYGTSGAVNNVLYYKQVVTLSQCQDLCAYNLTNCDFVSFNTAQGMCHFAEWCKLDTAQTAYTTYHNGAQPVPPAPTHAGETWGYCTSALGVPEQINIQVAANGSVVLAFVTFEAEAPAGPPTAKLNGKTFTGVTHTHITPAKDRTYYMHFVLVTGLTLREKCSYTVRSGAAGATDSAVHTFTAPHPAAGEATHVNIYGDMGIYKWNNMEWLQQDCRDDSATLIVHMGDHAYNEGEADERRGDGYMNGFQPVLAECPWMPNVGNHEYYDGLELSRYLDQTWEKWGPLPSLPAAEELKGASTATSALGYLLSAGNHHSAGVHGSHPSNTSRYFSVDFGLVHLVALDMNAYFGVDACGQTCLDAQMAWLKDDLAKANKNRDAVPWVVAFSHFPLYCTGCNSKSDYYESAAAELYGNANKTAATAWGKSPEGLKRLHEKGYKKSTADMVVDYQPVLQEYGVDLYAGGHWHYYESLFPAAPGNASCRSCAEPLQKNFDSPNVTVHITSGNGGPPGIDTFNESCPGPDCGSIPATRKQTTEFGYGRISATNRTHLTFRQFLNSNQSLFDEWTIVQPNHGPFPKAQ